MKDIGYFPKIYLSVEPVDFRKQIRGLSQIISPIFNLPPSDEKALYVFTNRKKDAVRIIYWDLTGFAMWSKLLEKNRFIWPKSSDQKIQVAARDLKWLLQGVDITKIKTHKKLNLRVTH